MRFFEVDSAVDAVMGAATIAQQKASAMGKQGQLSMNGFLQMLANAGIIMDYEGFKSVFDTNPQLKNVIAKFDKDTITFASDADEEQAGYEEPQTDMPDDERVAKMARRATKAREDVNEEQLDEILPALAAAGAVAKAGLSAVAAGALRMGAAAMRTGGVAAAGALARAGTGLAMPGSGSDDSSDNVSNAFQAGQKLARATERKLTKAEKAKLKDYEEEIPDQSFKDRYGERWKEVKYATMTKMAKRNA